jgi:hypothetical protein
LAPWPRWSARRRRSKPQRRCSSSLLPTTSCACVAWLRGTSCVGLGLRFSFECDSVPVRGKGAFARIYSPCPVSQMQLEVCSSDGASASVLWPLAYATARASVARARVEVAAVPCGLKRTASCPPADHPEGTPGGGGLACYSGWPRGASGVLSFVSRRVACLAFRAPWRRAAPGPPCAPTEGPRFSQRPASKLRRQACPGRPPLAVRERPPGRLCSGSLMPVPGIRGPMGTYGGTSGIYLNGDSTADLHISANRTMLGPRNGPRLSRRSTGHGHDDVHSNEDAFEELANRLAKRYGRAMIGIVSNTTIVGTTTGATEVIHSQAGLRAPAELRAPAATR